MNMVSMFLDRMDADSKVSKIPIDEHSGSFESGVGVGRDFRLGDNDDFMNVYSDHAWVHICVETISNAATKIPWSFYRLMKDGLPDLDTKLGPGDHPFIEAWQNPNPNDSWRTIKDALISWYLVIGNSYMELVRDENGINIQELYVPQADKITVVPHPKKRVGGYFFTPEKGGQDVPLSADQMIQFKTWNPYSDIYGLSPINAGGHAVITDLFAIESNKAILKNRAAPDFALETEQNLEDTQYKRLVRQLKRFKGPKNAHKTTILEGGLKWKAITMSMKDMEYMEQRRLNRTEIFAVYRVPPIVVGLMDGATRSNAVTQKKMFYEEAVVPIEIVLTQVINSQILRKDGIVVMHDQDVVTSLKEDKKEQSNIETRYVREGILTINEVRRSMGRKDVAWGDVYWAPQNLFPVEVPEDVENRPGSSQPTNDDSDPDASKPGSEEGTSHLPALHPMLESFGMKLIGELIDADDVSSKEVLSAVRKHFSQRQLQGVDS